MNKYKNAFLTIRAIFIPVIHKDKNFGEYHTVEHLYNTSTYEEYKSHFKLVEHLVNKETPIKLRNIRIDTSDKFWWGTCGKCGQDISFNKVLKNINYCDNCGQKIDWTDADE